MKKTAKRAISLIMVIVICSTSFFCVGANANGNDYEYNDYPLIVVRGFDIVSFAYEDGKDILDIKIPEIISVALTFLFQESFFLKDAATDTLISYANKLLGPIASDPKGDPIYKDVHIPQFKTSTAKFDISLFGKKHAQGLIHEAADQLGAENVYVFTFDWRKTPDVYAKELDELIEIATNEAKKAENRDSSVGFFEGQVTQEGGLYFDGAEIPPQDFIGIIKGYDEDKKMAILEQRNHFKLPQEFELIQPKGETKIFTLNEVYDEEGNVIVEARHAMQSIYLPIEKVKEYLKKND